MSTTPTPPPAAGWYPAPDGSPTVQWWDGVQWTPHRQPQPGQPRPVGGLTPSYPATTVPDGLTVLAMWTQILVGFAGVVSLVTIGVEIFGIGAINRYLDGTGDIDGLDSYDVMTSVVSIGGSVSVIAAGVLWAIWQVRAARRVIGLTRRTPGWHAGSWFIPLVSYWFPYQNVSDLWRASGGRRPGWQIVWWLLWCFGNAFVYISTQVYLRAETLEDYQFAASVSLTGEILMVAAAPFAILVVRGITQALEQHRSALASGFQPWQPR